jgi:MFS transporter, DHA1 family, inner membrane transport protein
VHPSQIGYAGAAALAAFYLPGLFAGYLLGKLIEIFGWSSASLFMPPLVGVGLMGLSDHSLARND